MTASWMTTLRTMLAPLRRLVVVGLALMLTINLAACSGVEDQGRVVSSEDGAKVLAEV